MALCVVVAVPEGIAVVTDSQVVGGFAGGPPSVLSHSADHIAVIGRRVIVASAGTPFVQTASGNYRSTKSILETIGKDFPGEETLVEDVCSTLAARFKTEAGIGEENPEVAAHIDLVVCGYDKSKVGRVFFLDGLGEPQERHSTVSPGIDWFGPIDVISRLIHGVDPRLEDVPRVEYIIPYHVLSLWDAADLGRSLVAATIEIGRFVRAVLPPKQKEPLPFLVPAGGPIDVAVVTPAGAEWIRHKSRP